MTARLKLVCHASTAAVRAAAFPADEPLEPLGLRKLATALRLGRADDAVVAPALRARQTAEALGLDAEVEPALRECDYGRWAGRSFGEIEADQPGALQVWLSDPAAAPHGGESLLEVVARVAAWLDRQRDKTGTIVAVTHATVIRAAILHAIGAPPAAFWRLDVAPLAMARLSGGSGRWTLTSLGPVPAFAARTASKIVPDG